MSTVAADIFRLKVLSQSLTQKGKRVSGVPGKMKRIVKLAEKEVNKKQYMEDIIKARFAAQRGYADGGMKWRKREVLGDGHPILNDTGKLLNSAVKAVKNTYNAVKVRWDIAKVKVSYGIYHQEGTEKMPARKFFLNPSKSELAKADKFFLKTLKKLLKGILR